MSKEKIAFKNLKTAMKRDDIAVKDMAKAAGITKRVMENKLAGKTEINLDEAFLIVGRLFPKDNIWVLFQELENNDLSLSNRNI